MAAPALVGLGTLVLARTGLRLRTRSLHQPEDVAVVAEQVESAALVGGSCESAKDVDDDPAGESAAANSAARDAQTPSLIHGATVCLVGPAGELMGLKSTTTGKSEEMALLPISTTTVEAGSSRRIQSYPSHSIFVVSQQGEGICLASPCAAGMLLEMGKDSTLPMKVTGRKPTKSNTWRLANGEWINCATSEKLSLKPQLLHAFSVDEMRERDRAVNNRERQLQAEVKHLRDRLRMDVTEHKELVAQVSEERLQSERDMSELDARVQNYQKMLKDSDEDCRRKGALLKQLEARLADISMGSDAAADGSGAVGDIVRHWQEQVATAEERAAAATVAHTKQAAAIRDEHTQEMAALRQEHSAALEALQAHAAAAEERAMAVAEAKQLTKLAEAEPAVAALQARTSRQADKIRQQNGVIRELATEVERLSDVERELLEEVQRLSYADHALTNISRSIVEATTPRDRQVMVVPRNPWQDRETLHERLVRENSLASSLSGRSRSHTAENVGGDGRPASGGRGRRLSAGDPGTLRESLQARRLSATSDAAQGIAVAREAIARSTSQWPSPPRPHMPTSLVPQTSVPEDEPLFSEHSGRPWSAGSAGSGIDFATAFAEAAKNKGPLDGAALSDTTNSPRSQRHRCGPGERFRGVDERGVENAPLGDQHSAAGGWSDNAAANHRMGMGQADVEFSKAAKEEMSVLQHNTRTLSRRQKPSMVRSNASVVARSTADDTQAHAHSDVGSAAEQPQQPASAMRRSVSLGSKPRPAALDLTCIPDLAPDPEDLAAAPADAAAGDTAANHAEACDAVVAPAPQGLAEIKVQPAKAVVRTPVAQRVMRMNKMSEAQELPRQLSGSDLSRATSGSSAPGRASGLQRATSSAAAPGRSGRTSGCVAAYRAPAPTSGLRRSVSGGTELPPELEQQLRAPEFAEDLRRSVESTGLKAHAALTAVMGDQGRAWATRPPTAPNPVGFRQGGRVVPHPQRSSMASSIASSSRLPRPSQQSAAPESAEEESCGVQHIVTRFNTPEKPQSGRRGDSPRWGRHRSVGSRSRHAHRALGVFSSRSFSAGAAGSAVTSHVRDSQASEAVERSSQNSNAADVQIGQDAKCGRRLSMGDPRVLGTSPARSNATAMHWNDKYGGIDTISTEAGSRPMFLHRNTVQSIDVKPW